MWKGKYYSAKILINLYKGYKNNYFIKFIITYLNIVKVPVLVASILLFTVVAFRI